MMMKVAAFLGMMMSSAVMAAQHDYGDALSKSILFFEGQRSGKLPSSQRMTWRKDSALQDGADMGVDLVGGYYDAGDNVKYNFPMAYSTTMLAWSVLEYRKGMGSDLQAAMDAIRWSTDYLLKATAKPNLVFVQVGQAQADHNCWERPEDMDTPRTAFAVTDKSPGSEVSAEIAAALAAASMVFKKSDTPYSTLLLQRASQVFEFADKFRGSYNDSLGQWVCPWYCDYSGYQDELLWAAAWLLKATLQPLYWNYVKGNIINFRPQIERAISEFGWDSKHAGINVLISKFALKNINNFIPYIPYADKFVCNVLPGSPLRSVSYTPGGLLYKSSICNIQSTTPISFLILTYARYLKKSKRTVDCGNGVTLTPTRLMQFAKTQVNYILGSNPANMSYMVGYGERFPQRIHHRGSSLPSVEQHPQRIECKEGTPYFQTGNPNPNLLIGAVVGGPDMNDKFYDDRVDAAHSEPTTYVNAPLVGLLAHFNKHPRM
nr:endoglucanase 17-like [Ipomoea trifida]